MMRGTDDAWTALRPGAIIPIPPESFTRKLRRPEKDLS
jgi:hypothetical protein